MKKRGKLFFSVLAILVVIMSMSILLVACKEAADPIVTPPSGQEQGQQDNQGGGTGDNTTPGTGDNTTPSTGGNTGGDEVIEGGGNAGGNEIIDGGGDEIIDGGNTGGEVIEGGDNAGGNTGGETVEPEPEKPELPDFDPNDSAMKQEESYEYLLRAFANTYMVDGKAVGWDLDTIGSLDLQKLLEKYNEVAKEIGLTHIDPSTLPLINGKLQIVSKGRLDPNSQKDTKFDMAINLMTGTDVTKLLELASDDQLLYVVVGGTTKVALKDFQLWNSIREIYIGTVTGDEIYNSVSAILLKALPILFDGGQFESTQNENTITLSYTNNLKELIDLLSPAIQEIIDTEITDEELKATFTQVLQVLNVLKTTDIHLGATIDRATYTLRGLELSLPDLDLGLKVDKASVSSDINPEIVLPDGSDAFPRINALNLSLNGDFVMKDEQKAPIYRAHWELLLDVNVFGYINDGLSKDKQTGALSFDPLMILHDDTNRLFLNVTHDCVGTSCTYCQTYKWDKKNDIKGSILSLAYAPGEFGSNNIMLSLDPRGVLPIGKVIADAVGMSWLDKVMGIVQGWIPDQVGTALDPYALFGITDNYSPAAKAVAFADGEVTPDAPAADPVMGAVVALLKTINLKDIGTNGLELGVPEIIELVKVAVNNDMVTNLLKDGLLVGASTIAITVAENGIAYGSVGENTKIQKLFATDYEGKDKAFTFDNKDASPIAKTTYKTTEDGVLRLSNSGVQNYDEKTNKSKPLTPDEIKKLMAPGVRVEFTSTDIFGHVSNEAVHAVRVDGFNENLIGVDQQVQINVSSPNGLLYAIPRCGSYNALEPILSLAKVDLKGILDGVANGHVVTTINIPTITRKVIENTEDNLYKYDPDKVYQHWFESGTNNNMDRCSLDLKAHLVIEYSNGKIVEGVDNPVNKSQYTDNYAFLKKAGGIWGIGEEKYPGRQVVTRATSFDAVYMLDGVEVGTRHVQVEPVKFLERGTNKTYNVGQSYAMRSEDSKLQITTQDGSRSGAYKFHINEAVTSVEYREDSPNKEGLEWTITDPSGETPGDVTFSFKTAGVYKVTVKTNFGVSQDYTFTVK